MAPKNDINNTNVVFAGLIGTLIVTVLVLALSVLFYHQANQQAAADADAVQSPELVSLLQTQRDILEGKAADADHKTHMPIERAMELVVADLAAGKATPVTPAATVSHAGETSHGK